MVRVKKRASKRLTIKQREKVNKKVREHHRKQRREAKRNPQWKSRRKADPGIPNAYPYKEDLLNEIEQQRRRAEEERMARREAATSDDADVDDDANDEEDEEAVDETLDEAPAEEAPLVLPHAPMLRRTLDQILAQPDDIRVMVYVLDSRDPRSFQNAWMAAALKSAKLPLIYVLDKADLVPAEVLTGWLYSLRAEGHTVFPVAVPDAISEHAGVDELAEHLHSHVKDGAAAVLGLQHVGKTTVATALQGAFQRRNEETTVYDSPMLVPSTMSLGRDDEDEDEDEEIENDEDTTAALHLDEKQRTKYVWTLVRNQGQVQRFKDPIGLVQTLLPRVAHPVDLMLAYGTPAFGSFVPARASLADDAPIEDVVLEQRRLADDKAAADTEQFLIGVARSVGRLKRLGVPDVLGAARIVLRDWSHAGIGYYAVPEARAKAVQAEGSEKDKKRWAEAEAAVAALPLVLPRKAWRQKWQVKELRLKTIDAPFLEEKLVFAPVDNDDVSEDDVPVYAAEDEDTMGNQDGEAVDDDDEIDDDEEMDDAINDEDVEDEDENVEDEDDVEDEDEDDLEPEGSEAPRLRGPISLAKLKALQAAKHKAPAKPAKARPAKTTAKAPAPRPGEAYNLNAYF